MLTRIVAIRHAKPKNSGYADEILRPLSEEGKIIQASMIQHLITLGIEPNIIYTSPILRARETAELIENEYSNSIPVKIIEELGYNFDENFLLSLIPSPILNQTVFMVGHMPTIAEFINHLIEEESLDEGLNTSSMAIIDFRSKIDFKQGNLIAVYHHEIKK